MIFGVMYLLFALGALALTITTLSRYIKTGEDRFLFVGIQDFIFLTFCIISTYICFAERVPLFFAPVIMSIICLFSWFSSWSVLEQKQEHKEFFRVITSLTLSITLIIGISFILRDVDYNVFSSDLIYAGTPVNLISICYYHSREAFLIFPFIQILFCIIKTPYLLATKQYKNDFGPILALVLFSFIEYTLSLPQLVNFYSRFHNAKSWIFLLVIFIGLVYLLSVSRYKSLAYEQVEKTVQSIRDGKNQEKLLRLSAKRIKNGDVCNFSLIWICLENTGSIVKTVKIIKKIKSL